MAAVSCLIRLRALAGLVALLAGELLAVRALHALAAVPGLAAPPAQPAGWGSWLQATTPPDALAAILRLLALGLGWWLLASTVLSVLVGIAGWRPGRHLAGVLVLPAVRRLVDRALAGMLAASVALGPSATASIASASAAPAPLPPVWGSEVQQEPRQKPTTPTPTPAPETADTAVVDGDVHVLLAGEHLWRLAEDTVRSGRPTAPASEVAAYWRAVVEVNRPRIRSGDPDLVFPGERIVLPARQARPTGPTPS